VLSWYGPVESEFKGPMRLCFCDPLFLRQHSKNGYGCRLLVGERGGTVSGGWAVGLVKNSSGCEL
jgi:hypothetical protein